MYGSFRGEDDRVPTEGTQAANQGCRAARGTQRSGRDPRRARPVRATPQAAAVGVVLERRSHARGARRRASRGRLRSRLILVDTSAILALLDRDAHQHDTVDSFVAENEEALVLSPFVLAVLDDVSEGAYELAPFSPDDVARARTIIAQYRDLRIGLADASLVVLAERSRTNCVLTLDERHFRALRVGRRRFV